MVIGRVTLLKTELLRKHFKIQSLSNGLFNGSAAVLHFTAYVLKGLLYIPSWSPILSLTRACLVHSLYHNDHDNYSSFSFRDLIVN